MKPWQNLLSDGLQALQQADDDIKCVITPRNEEIIAILDRYIREIELFNQAYGLVGIKNSEELVIKHILDSLTPLGIICRLLAAVNGNKKPPQTSGLKIADAGSGAGLPGIPLAIALPNCHFTLIERMGRRAGFLLNTKAVLGIPNITVEENELEKISLRMDADGMDAEGMDTESKNTSGRFSLITFRAFKPLEPKLLKTLFSVCAYGGFIAAYKGRREKIEQEISVITNNNKQKSQVNSFNYEIYPYKVPFLNENRHLLIMGTSKNPGWVF